MKGLKKATFFYYSTLFSSFPRWSRVDLQQKMSVGNWAKCLSASTKKSTAFGVSRDLAKPTLFFFSVHSHTAYFSLCLPLFLFLSLSLSISIRLCLSLFFFEFSKLLFLTLLSLFRTSGAFSLLSLYLSLSLSNSISTVPHFFSFCTYVLFSPSVLFLYLSLSLYLSVFLCQRKPRWWGTANNFRPEPVQSVG